jgi:hypothetical protein
MRQVFILTFVYNEGIVICCFLKRYFLALALNLALNLVFTYGVNSRAGL